MDEQSRELLATVGFSNDNESNHFYGYAVRDDLEYAINSNKPNHFTPQDWRSVFVAQMYEGTDNEFWYVTSTLRGTFRGYRCRNTYRDYDTANIFASGKTCFEAVNKWVYNYINRSYNKS